MGAGLLGRLIAVLGNQGWNRSAPLSPLSPHISGDLTEPQGGCWPVMGAGSKESLGTVST